MTDALVATSWFAEHMHEPDVKLIEVSSNGLDDYARGHLPGAGAIDWQRDLIEKEDESSGLIPNARSREWPSMSRPARIGPGRSGRHALELDSEALSS